MKNANQVSGQEQGRKSSTRLHYLDWLRVIAIVGVWTYHSARPFMVQEWLINSSQTSLTITAVFLVFLGSMGMPLFFTMAGIGCLFALRRRTGRQVAMERTKRLFIPFVVGCILLSPLQFYMEWVHKGWYQGSFLLFVPVLVQDRLHMFTTTFSPSIFQALGSHLWFLGYLFTFALIALPLFLWLKTESGRRAIAWLGKLGERRGGLLVFILPAAAVRMSLQPFFPGYTDWTDYAYMLVFFVCGYILFADERMVGAIRRDWKLALSVGILSTLTMLGGLAAGGQRWVQDPSSPGFYLGWGLVAVNGWCLTLFALWLGMRFLDFRNRWLDRGQELIVPFYLFHQPPIVALAFFAVQWPVGLLAQLAVVVLGSLAITIGLCELVARRIKPVRALFGMKPSCRLESTRMLAESRDRVLPGHRIAPDIG
jgi:peptidoglycan/LPS O-acetylase OafA/YrhL